MFDSNALQLRNLRVGDEKVISVRTYHSTATSANAYKNPTSGWFLGVDPQRSTVITATNSGANVTQFRGAASGAANLWLSVSGRVASGAWSYETDVAAYASGVTTGLWTVNPLPVVPPAGATLTLLGYPVLPRTSATLSGNKGSVTVLPSGANSYTGYAGERRIIYRPDFGTEAEEVVGMHTVDGSL